MSGGEYTNECTDKGLVGNTLFVDSVFGNNKTAQPFNGNLVYLTIREAIKAAIPLAQKGPIRISVRPGQYREGRLFPRSNMSIEGSGRLVTQIFGTFDTRYVTDVAEMTVLELSVISQNTVAIQGLGIGRSSFRRIKASANYFSGKDGQYAILSSVGNHIITDSEIELNSTGGSNIYLHHLLGSSLTLERNTNSLNVSPLPEVSHKLTKGGVNYTLGDNMNVVLPYTEENATILDPFLITQMGGTSSRIHNNYCSLELYRGQTAQITTKYFDHSFTYVIEIIADNGEVTNMRLQPSLPTQALAVYSTLSTLQFFVRPDQNFDAPPLRESNIQLIIEGGRGTVNLPSADSNINFVYTFAGPGVATGYYQLASPYRIIVNGEVRTTVRITSSLVSVHFDQNSYTANYSDQTAMQSSSNVDAQLRTLNNRSAISSSTPISDVDSIRITQRAITTVPATNSVGETHSLQQPNFQLLVGQTPAITGNGVKAFQLQGKVNFTIGPSVVLAVRLLVPRSAIGSTALVFRPDIFAVSDQGNEQAFTFPQAGIYTIDNSLDEHVWIVQYFGNDTNLLHIFGAEGSSGPKVAMNNGTLETGNTVQGLIKSNAKLAQVHVNTLTAFDTDYIPAINVPVEARKLTAVQQISTAREHLRGGSQIEEQDTIPARTEYTVPINTRNLILQGGNTINMPTGVSVGTIIGISVDDQTVQDSIIRGGLFVYNGERVNQVTVPSTFTKQLLFSTTVINGSQPAWLVT